VMSRMGGMSGLGVTSGLRGLRRMREQDWMSGPDAMSVLGEMSGLMG
jgi:hypothetical protein